MSAYIQRPSLEEPFRRMLETDQPPRVLNLYSTFDGQPLGGMGKTRLLQHYATLCPPDVQVAEILDFRLTDNQSRTSVCQHVANQLDPGQKQGYFAGYWEIRRTYNAERQRRGKEVLEGAFVELEKQLDAAWQTGFDRFLERRRAVLLVDTWEAVADTDIGSWLASQLKRLQHLGHLTLVIAGRPPLRWPGLEVRACSVGPFSLDETRRYAASRGYVESGAARAEVPPGRRTVGELVEAIHEATLGHPVLIAWAFDYGDRGIDIERAVDKAHGDPAAFRQELVEETLAYPDTDYPLLLWSACLHRNFSAAVLQPITGWDEDKCQDALRRLRADFPSIVRSGPSPDSCEPHDEVRDILIRYGWPLRDRERKEWKLLRDQAKAYYNQMISDSPRADPTDMAEAGNFRAERLYYLFDDCIRSGDRHKCLRAVWDERFRPDFDDAVKSYHLGDARQLIGEAGKFLNEFDEQLRDTYWVSQSYLFMREGRIDDGLAASVQVQEQAAARGDYPTLALAHLQAGRCKILQGRYAEAVEEYERANDFYEMLKDYQGQANVLRYQGLAHYSRGHWSAAQTAYRESRKAAEQAVRRAHKGAAPAAVRDRVASAMNQEAQVALMEGNTSEANGLAAGALAIWREINSWSGEAEALMTQARANEMEERLAESADLFLKAIDLYKGHGSEWGQSRAQVFLARVRRRQQQFDDAEKLARESLGVFQLHNRLTQIGFALSELGTINREQGDLEESEKYFREALSLAEQIGDTYRKVEVLEDLVLLARRRGQPAAEIEALLQEFETLAEQEQYALFLGRAKEHRGNMAWERGETEQAFIYYAEACRVLVRYHNGFYRQIEMKVEDRFYALPWSQVPRYADLVIKLWTEWGLHEKYPGLIQRAQKAKDLAESFEEGGDDDDA